MTRFTAKGKREACFWKGVWEQLTSFSSYVYTLLELMDRGTLQSALKAGPVPEKILGVMAGMMLDGLAYIHKEFHVLHRDLVRRLSPCFSFSDVVFSSSHDSQK